jgi:glycerol-3-phosphate dehydrogenase
MPRPLKTHCKHGHLLSPENILIGRRCRTCRALRVKLWAKDHPEKVKASWKKWEVDHPEEKKSNELRSRYGITTEQKEAKIAAQEGLCPVCTRKLVEAGKSAMDHDHACCPGNDTCGKCLRDVLCHRCNLLLGCAQDNIQALENAIAYLKKHKETQIGN